MANTVDKIIELARIEDGYIEKASNAQLDSKTANKGSNNYQKYSRDVNNVGLMGCQGQPWCCTHQFWLDLKCFGKETALKLWNMNEKTYVGYNCFSTYNTFNKVGKVGKEPKIGALVIFTFSHVGRVLNVYERDGKKYIECQEGNTSSNLSDRNGGQVKIRERYAYSSDIKGYCYIDYDNNNNVTSYSTENISVGTNGLCITGDLNIRDNPGVSGTKIIGNYKKNDKVFPTKKVIADNKPWYKTDKGWISSSYCEGWVKESNSKCKYLLNGCFITNDWKEINGKWYCFDNDGYIVTDKYVKSSSKNVWYYLDNNGIWDGKDILTITGTVYNCSRLNIRSKNNTSGNIITSIAVNTKVIILDESNGWYYVSSNGVKGWVSGKYIKLN